MIAVAISLLPLAIWAYLLFGRGWFWLCGERDDFAAVVLPPLVYGTSRTLGPASW